MGDWLNIPRLLKEWAPPMYKWLAKKRPTWRFFWLEKDLLSAHVNCLHLQEMDKNASLPLDVSQAWVEEHTTLIMELDRLGIFHHHSDRFDGLSSKKKMEFYTWYFLELRRLALDMDLEGARKLEI